MKFNNLWTLNFLWLVPLLLFALIYEMRKKRIALQNFADQDLVARLTGEESRRKIILKNVLLVLTFILLVLAVAGPRWGSHYQEVKREGVDIMLLVDVSPSMLVEDVKPNRLERARREITDFLRVIQGDRVGLIAFSGKAFVQCPLTLDHGACQMFLSSLNPDLIPVSGTDIGTAIDLAVNSFDMKEETDRVVLLITDGEDNEGRGLEAAERAAEKDVKIFVFGMGDPTGGPVPSADGQGGFLKDKSGKVVLSKLDEESLRKAADVTGGDYVRSIAGDLDLDILYFDGIRSKTDLAVLKSGKVKVYEERFMIFLIAAFLLLLLEGFINVRNLRDV